ncbi:DUF4397 domain-containing protein [Bacillus lacus]|uniref:DUF4397 domain-containing protein n=1 Tax=Metabacillus lacus TaxID=1983721 RepID=A0A7X2IXY0_9BACI|nr:DUF4397 domain-containing protein [Metabacillus lacus]MRX71714.1 DUF4397 domain-containing protein [Metabacillus lacus]
MYDQNQLYSAIIYDQLAKYYKYIDPNKHIMYYQQHLHAMHQALGTHQQGQQQAYGQRQHMSPGYTKVRILHASPDAPAVDIYANGNPILRNVAYKKLSDYLQIPAGQYRIDIYAAGTQNRPVLTENVIVMPGVAYTVAAVGNVSNLKLFPIVDRPFVSAGETKVKFVHLSPDAPAVDVGVKGGGNLFNNISFMTATKYVSVPPGKVDLEVKVAGTDTVALSVPKVQLKADKSYTVFAVGFANGTPKLEALLSED